MGHLPQESPWPSPKIDNKYWSDLPKARVINTKIRWCKPLDKQWSILLRWLDTGVLDEWSPEAKRFIYLQPTDVKHDGHETSGQAASASCSSYKSLSWSNSTIKYWISSQSVESSMARSNRSIWRLRSKDTRQGTGLDIKPLSAWDATPQTQIAIRCRELDQKQDLPNPGEPSKTFLHCLRLMRCALLCWLLKTYELFDIWRKIGEDPDEPTLESMVSAIYQKRSKTV